MVGKKKEMQGTLVEILRRLEEKSFHGAVTIHYTNGKPRKIEYRMVESLDGPVTE